MFSPEGPPPEPDPTKVSFALHPVQESCCSKQQHLECPVHLRSYGRNEAQNVEVAAMSTKPCHQITLRNRDNVVIECAEDEAIYDACLRAGFQLPIACAYGGCITCAAKLIDGKVRQPGGTALNKRQSQSGFILLCVAHPIQDCVLDVGVESHDGLYQNPFASPTRRR